MIHLTEKVTDCAARLAAVEAERDELEQALEEGAKALVALHAAEARVEAAEQERDEAEENGETAMVQRDLAMARCGRDPQPKPYKSSQRSGSLTSGREATEAARFRRLAQHGRAA